MKSHIVINCNAFFNKCPIFTRIGEYYYPVIMIKNQLNKLSIDLLDRPDLIKKLNDQELMDHLNRFYGNYIYTLAYNKIKSTLLSNEDIEDCFIDIIIRLSEKGCKKIRKFSGKSSFKTYLTVVSRNLITDYIRREKRNTERSVNDITDETINSIITTQSYDNGDPEIGYLKSEKESLVLDTYDIVRKGIDKLEAKERLIITLKLEKKFTYREIDEFLGIDNSRYHFVRTIQKLKDSLDPDIRKSIESILQGDEYAGS